MKFLDEFRDPLAADKLLAEIHSGSSREWVLMEVCGGQTHGLLRYGIDQSLKGVVELVHGPGCPVCVTPTESIDFAQKMALEKNVILASFGDMLRVPGSEYSLQDVRGLGGDVRIVYSPLDAVNIARNHPDREVVFFAVGFETTAPATALAVLQAEREGLKNFCLLVSHVRVQPAMESLMKDPENRVEAFLAAGHVCTIAGTTSYADFATRYRVPVVVTGFEPLDLLNGILACVRQLESGEARVENQYSRSVRLQGNRSAQDLIDQVYEIRDSPWRGFASIPQGGLRLRSEYSAFDAFHRFSQPTSQKFAPATECQSAKVLAGKIKPTDCPAFGKNCTPDSPLGAPMVSSEGACAAYFRYLDQSKASLKTN